MASLFTKFILSLSFIYLIVGNSNAQIVPYQPGAYYPGLANLRDFAPAPSGFYVFNYNYFIQSNGYYNSSGKNDGVIDANGIPFNVRQSDISGYVNASSIAYMSDWSILGGKYQAMVQFTYLTLDYDAVLVVGEPQPPISGTDRGWSDIAITPIGIGWSFEKKLDVSFLYTTYLPTGKYDTEGQNNVGQGHWTHQFQLPSYFYLNDQATAIGVIPTLEINGDVLDVDARFGNRFSLEYGLSQYVTDWLELELVSTHSWQLSDDQGDAIWWQDTPFFSRDQRHAYAVGLGVWPGVDWLNMRLRYTSDYAAKQSFRANIFSFSFLFVPNMLNK